MPPDASSSFTTYRLASRSARCALEGPPGLLGGVGRSEAGEREALVIVSIG